LIASSASERYSIHLRPKERGFSRNFGKMLPGNSRVTFLPKEEQIHF